MKKKVFVSHITFVFKYCICFKRGKCSLNHANHCPDSCTTNDQRMGLAFVGETLEQVLKDIPNPG